MKCWTALNSNEFILFDMFGSCFLVAASLTDSSAVFVIYWPNFSTMCGQLLYMCLCDSILKKKKDTSLGDSALVVGGFAVLAF